MYGLSTLFLFFVVVVCFLLFSFIVVKNMKTSTKKKLTKKSVDGELGRPM